MSTTWDICNRRALGTLSQNCSSHNIKIQNNYTYYFRIIFFFILFLFLFFFFFGHFRLFCLHETNKTKAPVTHVFHAFSPCLTFHQTRAFRRDSIATSFYTIRIQETIQHSLSLGVSRETTGRSGRKTARRRAEIRFNGNANEWDFFRWRHRAILYRDRFVSE